MPARASIGDTPGRSTRAVWFRPPRVPGAAQREPLKAFTLVSAGDGRVVRCRPGIVTHTAFATVPDQRCTASLSLALRASGTRARYLHVVSPATACSNLCDHRR